LGLEIGIVLSKEWSIPLRRASIKKIISNPGTKKNP